MTYRNLKLNPPFVEDCTRQSQLNRSVDRILRDQMSSIGRQRIEPQATSLKPQTVRAMGEVISGLLFFATLIGCAYLGMAL